MLTMRPPPRARMCGSTAREQRICANSLMSRSACHCSSLSVSKLPGVARPALLTRRSIPPKRSTAAATKRSMSSRFVTSATSASAARPHARPISAPAASISAWLREQIATSAPSRASSSAMACPSPLLPPVTRATLPCKPSSIDDSLRHGIVLGGIGRCGLDALQHLAEAAARGREDVQAHARFVKRPGAVRHVRGHDVDVAGADHPLFAVHLELVLALEDGTDLLLRVLVQRRFRVRLEVDEVDQQVAPEYRFEADTFAQVDEGNLVRAGEHGRKRRVDLNRRIAEPEVLVFLVAGGVAHDTVLSGASVRVAAVSRRCGIVTLL